MLIVSDSSPLISMYSAGLIELLPQLTDKIIIPPAVQKEIVQSNKEGGDYFHQAVWLEVRACESMDEVTNIAHQYPVLHRGEIEAIVLAKELDADYLAIDEKKGRAVAKGLHIRTIGVIGLLVIAKGKGLIPEVGQAIQKLINVGFRVNPLLVEAVLKDQGEL